MNLPINLKLAKLLKEKEFNETCTTIVTEENTYHLVSSIEHTVINGMVYPTTINKRLPDNIYTAPTIAEVVMWLYEKYGIWIEVKVPDMKGEYWSYSIHKPYRYGSLGNGDLYNSPTEAYEDAIEYILNNLI